MKAVDVVLLPPLGVMERAIDLNRQIIEAGNTDITLDKEKCFPHITLSMGCIKEEDVRKVDGILRDIANSFSPIKLEILPTPDAGRAWMRIEKSRDIELLHEIIMIRLSPFFNYRITPDMLYKERSEALDEDIDDITMDYVRRFPVGSSFETYEPHITLGTGVMELKVGHFNFISHELALCHLGRFCTCRKVLVSHKLGLEQR